MIRISVIASHGPLVIAARSFAVAVSSCESNVTVVEDFIGPLRVGRDLYRSLGVRQVSKVIAVLRITSLGRVKVIHLPYLHERWFPEAELTILINSEQSLTRHMLNRMGRLGPVIRLVPSNYSPGTGLLGPSGVQAKPAALGRMRSIVLPSAIEGDLYWMSLNADLRYGEEWRLREGAVSRWAKAALALHSIEGRVVE